MPCGESSETQSICYSREREVGVTANVSLKIPQNNIEIVVCPHWAYSVWFRSWYLNSARVYWNLTMCSAELDAEKTPKAKEITPIFSMLTSKALFIHCLIFTIVLKYRKWENWGFQSFYLARRSRNRMITWGWFSPKPHVCSLTHSLTLLPPSFSFFPPSLFLLHFYL